MKKFSEVKVGTIINTEMEYEGNSYQDLGTVHRIYDITNINGVKCRVFCIGWGTGEDELSIPLSDLNCTSWLKDGVTYKPW